MKIVAKLGDGSFPEIGVREISEAEDDETRSSGLGRRVALGVVAVGAIALARRLRRSSSDRDTVGVKDDGSIEIEN